MADKKKLFALQQACLDGEVEIAQGLLSGGPPYLKNMEDSDGKIPLHYASIGGFKEVVWHLLNAKCDVNNTDKDLRTPLLLACLHGHVEAARCLLNRGAVAVLNKVDKFDLTPLHCACREGHVAVTQLLLDHRQIRDCLQKKYKHGKTPLIYACINGHQDVARALLRSPHLQNKSDAVNAGDTDGLSALHYSCNRGHRHVTRLLLDNGADLYKEDKDGCNPLQHLSLFLHGKTSAEADEKDAVLDKGGGEAKLFELLESWMACKDDVQTPPQLEPPTPLPRPPKPVQIRPLQDDVQTPPQPEPPRPLPRPPKPEQMRPLQDSVQTPPPPKPSRPLPRPPKPEQMRPLQDSVQTPPQPKPARPLPRPPKPEQMRPLQDGVQTPPQLKPSRPRPPKPARPDLKVVWLQDA
ncbi:ankyrin repeat-containing domain protein [Dunaliella salina]|uniref:Ankyrin repeat-containing domain protein n=1 Tax=Dunaliella salina TaxID=3046 RepID=A0ABQ7H8M5_DUNSA|nr:ankyrin repeat-containing domain protein [Dunaliella salina]|eukprot:KAF5843211.1 ankyrin repeat-containing domain protein [Dunaliella salina]